MKYKNKLSIHYWLRKIYTSKLYQQLPLNKNLLKKRVFTSIYKSNHWVQGENTLSKNSISVSGHGSNINTDQFYNLSKNFTKIIESYGIKSILDIPCGDFLWMHEIIRNKNIEYLGIDIVDDLIKKNKNNYLNKNFSFENHDVVNYIVDKKFDLIVIRDFFIHINNQDILKVINNLKQMDFKYLVVNSYNNIKNQDVIIGQHRKVNLLIEPFFLKKPSWFFKDYENDKLMLVYEKKYM